MTQTIQTPEQRLAGVIGQIIVENAKLGYEIEITRAQVQQANERANALSVDLADARARLAAETARADAAEQKLNEPASAPPSPE